MKDQKIKREQTTLWWAGPDSDRRPSARQADVLTRLDDRPTFCAVLTSVGIRDIYGFCALEFGRATGEGRLGKYDALLGVRYAEIEPEIQAGVDSIYKGGGRCTERDFSSLDQTSY